MDPVTEAISCGRKARADGRFAEARQHYAQAAKVHRDGEDFLAYAHTIRHIADIFQQEANLVEAKPIYEECLELYRSNLSTRILDLANTVRPYAILNEELGDVDIARKLWEEARSLYGSIRLSQGVSECDAHLSKLQQAWSPNA